MTAAIRELAITVLPEYAQSDGVASVLDRLALAGATGLTTSPYVVAEAAEGTGLREPPIDGGAGKGRLLDRALWGKREVWMNAASSFTPDPALYDGLAYRPPEADAVTEASGAVVGDFLDAARARGLETWMQIQAAIPPCHRVQFGGPVEGDAPLMPDGRPRPGRVDNNASLAAPGLRAYLRAYLTDLCRAYPQVDGFKFDWPEYPAYHFDALLFDFNPAAAPFAAPLGLDFEGLRKGVLAFLAELSDGSIRRRRIALDDAENFRDSLLAAYPVLGDLLAFRAAIVADYGRFLREALDEASGGRCAMFLQTFPPPFDRLNGFDPEAMAPLCDMIGVKFYTMHWPMIERDYLGALQSRGDFAPEAVAPVLARLLALAPPGARQEDAIRYPEPHEPHPGPSEAITAKMKAARAAIPEGTRVCGISHGYGPTDDVLRRLRAVAAGADGEVHLNRFGYLADDKLEGIGALVSESPATHNPVQ